MTVNPQITALIPTYKRPEYLRRAIKSVLRQTYSNLQVCVFDDASGDNTEQVVLEIIESDSRVKYYCQKSNIGSVANYRYAFQSVETPYFSVLSDDDFLSEDFYENAIRILEENPDIMFVITNTICIDENRDLTDHRLSDNSVKFFREGDRFDAMHTGVVPHNWTAMVYRRDVMDVYMDMEDRYDIAYDMRYLLRAAARYKYAYLSKVGAFFTTHKKSISAARKNLDHVHLGVMISRYIEIINDEHADPYAVKRSLYYIKNIMHSKYYQSVAVNLLKMIIKNSCEKTEYVDSVIKRDISSFESEGYLKTSLLFKRIYESDVIRGVFRVLFSSYSHRLSNRYKTDLLSLQRGRYSEIFKYIEEMSAGCSEIVDIDDSQKLKLKTSSIE